MVQGIVRILFFSLFIAITPASCMQVAEQKTAASKCTRKNICACLTIFLLGILVGFYAQPPSSFDVCPLIPPSHFNGSISYGNMAFVPKGELHSFVKSSHGKQMQYNYGCYNVYEVDRHALADVADEVGSLGAGESDQFINALVKSSLQHNTIPKHQTVCSKYALTYSKQLRLAFSEKLRKIGDLLTKIFTCKSTITVDDQDGSIEEDNE